MQFFLKISQIIGWRSLRAWYPHLENSETATKVAIKIVWLLTDNLTISNRHRNFCKNIYVVFECDPIPYLHSLGATVHDMFNWATVIILLPLEIIIDSITGNGGYLYHLSKALVDAIPLPDGDSEEVQFLDAITDPFTSLIVQVYEYKTFRVQVSFWWGH